jgi:3-oxoacyl-[acyl-carrier-protein] synthase II
MVTHSHPFRLIDRVVSAGPDRCKAVKMVTSDEVLLDEAGRPGVYPPALVVEALAQAALPLDGGNGAGGGRVAGASAHGGAAGVAAPARGMIVAMDRVRLHRPVVAGDRLDLTAVIAARLGELIRVESRAEVAGTVVAEGEFTIATAPDAPGGGPGPGAAGRGALAPRSGARRVVVTGCGVVSALADTAPGTWEALLAGRVGIRPITLFDTARDRTRTAAQAGALDRADLLLAPRERRRASRGDRMGLMAAFEAVWDGGLELARMDRRRAGVIIGGGGSGLLQAEDRVRRTARGERARPTEGYGFFGSVTTDRVASALGFRGATDTIMNACSSSTIAIGLGAARIASGDLDLVLAGGVEPLSRTTFAGFNALRLVDPDPCRPFDRDRRGMSLGECAAFLLLEDRERALGRGARVYAEVAGHGMSADAWHATAPEPEGDGLARSMRAALRAAGVAPEEVDHVNAHGTATEQNDRAEARALKTVFGTRTASIPVASIKGMVGHCLGAAGAIEAFATVMSLHYGAIPPTAGLRDPDPDFGLDLVAVAARRADLRVALSNSTAFGGNNGTLVLRRHKA